MDDPIKVIWKLKNKNKNTHYHIYIFIGDILSKSTIDILNKIKLLKFYSIEEVDAIMQNQEIQMDRWTRLSWPFVKDYLEKI